MGYRDIFQKKKNQKRITLNHGDRVYSSGNKISIFNGR